MRLRAGDVLLFNRQGLYNKIIMWKTWSQVSHVEVAIDQFSSLASRNGVGVGRYSYDFNGLHSVLRPKAFFNYEAAMKWFETVNGQGYDWLGLLAFISAKYQGRDNGKMFCSEFATRLLRAGGIDPFNGYDADGIAPSEFLKSPVFERVELLNEKVFLAPR